MFVCGFVCDLVSVQSLGIREYDSSGEETVTQPGHEGLNASVLFARWQEGEEMCVDIHNAGGTKDAM